MASFRIEKRFQRPDPVFYPCKVCARKHGGVSPPPDPIHLRTDRMAQPWVNMRKMVTNNTRLKARKLTLNDFPMEYGVKDVQQRSLTSRQERSRLQDRLLSARKESETLREYSRRRFQTVVDWETQPSSEDNLIVPKIQTSARPKTTTGARPSSLPQPPQTPTTPTNGPTKDGSILYNGKPLLLSAIRTRPNSEPPSRFDHLRGAHGKTYPYIQKTLEQSNCEYRVGVSPCHTAREERHYEGELSPDFVMLIPVTSEADDADGGDAEKGRKVQWKNEQAWTEEGPLLASTARSRSPRSEERSDTRFTLDLHGVNKGQGRNEFSCEDEVHGRQSPADRESPPDMAVVPQETPDSPTPTPSSPPPRQTPSPQAHPLPSKPQTVSPPPPSPKSPTPTTTLPTTTLPTTTTTTSNPPMSRPPSSTPSSRPQSARSEVSSISSVSITPRPHCWVDDVTVSSDESLTERDLSLQNELDDRLSVHSQDPATRGQLQGLTAQLPTRVGSPSGDKKKSMPLGKRVTSPLLKRAPSGGKAKAGAGGGGGGCPRSLKHSSASGSRAGGIRVGEGEGLGMVKEGEEAGDEGEGAELVLPRFLCPSSESKSRQAAIKEWLAKTSFASACRTVPLT